MSLETIEWDTLALVFGGLALVGAVVAVLLLTRRRVRPSASRAWPGSVADALRLVLEGDRAGASASLRAAVESGDADPSLYLALGVLLRVDGDVDRATALHRGLTVRRDIGRPLQAEAWRQVALDCVAARNTADALRACSAALEVLPDDPELLALDRDVAYEADELERALASHARRERALDRPEPRIEASLRAASAAAYLRGEELRPARRELKRAHKLDPTCARAAFETARLEAGSEEPEAAADLLAALVASEPGLESLVLPHLAAARQAAGDEAGLAEVREAAARVTDRPSFVCGSCGRGAAAVAWRCPECGAWESWARPERAR